jgi:hypothetical protein
VDGLALAVGDDQAEVVLAVAGLVGGQPLDVEVNK